MAISWAQYKARRNIDVDAWVKSNNLKTAKDVEEKLKALGIRYPSDDSDIKSAMRKNKKKKSRTPAERSGKASKPAPQKKADDKDET